MRSKIMEKRNEKKNYREAVQVRVNRLEVEREVMCVA